MNQVAYDPRYIKNEIRYKNEIKKFIKGKCMNKLLSFVTFLSLVSVSDYSLAVADDDVIVYNPCEIALVDSWKYCYKGNLGGSINPDFNLEDCALAESAILSFCPNYGVNIRDLCEPIHSLNERHCYAGGIHQELDSVTKEFCDKIETLIVNRCPIENKTQSESSLENRSDW